MGAAAYVAGGGTFLSFGELVRWAERSPRRMLAPVESTKGDPLWRAKKGLLLLMAIGTAAYFGLSGTFASFSAETSNLGSGIASGTLTMSDQVNAGTMCLSANGVVNANTNCTKVLNLTNVAPGGINAAAQVTIQNTGSLDASKLYLFAPYVNSTLTTQVLSGAGGPFTIAPLEGSVTAGDHIRVTYGGQFQDFTATGAVAALATSIPVSGVATATFPVGSVVTDIDSNTTPTTTDCYDVKTSAGATTGATSGNDLNFISPIGNPFCRAVLMYVQETTNNKHYCWVGNGSGTAICKAPTSVTLTSGINGTVNFLPVGSVNGNVTSGDTIHVVSGANSQDFVALGNTFAGAASIAVNPLLANFSYPTGSTVVDTTAASALNSDATNTISHFDTAFRQSGQIQLRPVTADGVIDQTATVELAHYNTGLWSRTFQVGLYLPAPNGINQNPLQGLASTFGMTWHIDQ
ncbi:MAG: hypothetical protein JWO17_3114 [Actinomycetia bacterium]|nr:hypothetical protein [Actinomycetes bacterium]